MAGVFTFFFDFETLGTNPDKPTTEVITMQDQDSATIVITFLFLLPWLGRAAVSAMAVWQAGTESQTKKARVSQTVPLP
jgi:hypothetical protein